jgi:hypothetical protein
MFIFAITEYYKDHDLLQGSLKNLGKMFVFAFVLKLPYIMGMRTIRFYGTPFFPVEDILQNLIEVVGPKNEVMSRNKIKSFSYTFRDSNRI